MSCYALGMSGKEVHIVMAGDYVLDVYTHREMAWAHARTITGATVIHCTVREHLPPHVVDDLEIEALFEYDKDELTPLEMSLYPLLRDPNEK